MDFLKELIVVLGPFAFLGLFIIIAILWNTKRNIDGVTFRREKTKKGSFHIHQKKCNSHSERHCITIDKTDKTIIVFHPQYSIASTFGYEDETEDYALVYDAFPSTPSNEKTFDVLPYDITSKMFDKLRLLSDEEKVPFTSGDLKIWLYNGNSSLIGPMVEDSGRGISYDPEKHLLVCLTSDLVLPSDKIKPPSTAGSRAANDLAEILRTSS